MKKIQQTYKKIMNDLFWKNMFTNSFWAFAGDSSASVINLIITILLIKLLGNYNYGILILAQSYMSIIDVIFNIQCWKSVIIFGQKSLVNNNQNNFLYYIKVGYIIDIITAMIGAIISYVFARIVGNVFNWTNEMIVCCQIFSFTVFSHLSGTSTAILRLLDKFNLVALQKFLTSIIKLVAFAFLMFANINTNLINATIIYSLTDIIGNLLLVIFALLVILKKYKIKTILTSKKTSDIKEFIKLTLWGTLSEIVDIPIQYLDVFIISILSTDLVSVLKVFRQIVNILQKVTSPLQQSLLPQFSELVAQNHIKRSYDVVIKIRNVVLKYGLQLAIVFGVSSILWLKWLYGDIYASYWYVLLIYLIIQTIALSYSTLHTLFLALNYQRESTIYTLVANVIYFICGYIFVYAFGLIGVVMAAGIQYFISIYLKDKKIKRTI